MFGSTIAGVAIQVLIVTVLNSTPVEISILSAVARCLGTGRGPQRSRRDHSSRWSTDRWCGRRLGRITRTGTRTRRSEERE